jgi:heterotetrameric sarcosine oxidase delta subunit
MFQIPCPHCGPRNVSEFRHVGERRARPDVRTATPGQWRVYLYEQDNVAGWSAESWYHSFGCRRFVAVERHTVTNEVRPVSDPEDSAPGAESTS